MKYYKNLNYQELIQHYNNIKNEIAKIILSEKYGKKINYEDFIVIDNTLIYHPNDTYYDITVEIKKRDLNIC